MARADALPSPPARPSPPEPWRRRVTARAIVFCVLLAIAAWAFARVAAVADTIAPTRGGLDVAAAFAVRAITPALSYENEVPASTRPLLLKAAEAARATVSFAAAAMILALGAGLVLAFF